MIVRLQPFVLKMSVLVLILASGLPLKYSLPLCLFVTWVYKYLIALLYGVHAMPSMDVACFLGTSDAARVNFISVTTTERYSFELAVKRARKMLE